MPKIFLACALLLTLTSLAQPAAAQVATPAASDQVQVAELPDFLASLADGAPQKVSEIGTQNHCVPSTWCEDLKAECALDCAPCGVNYAICYHYICDVVCSCKAC